MSIADARFVTVNKRRNKKFPVLGNKTAIELNTACILVGVQTESSSALNQHWALQEATGETMTYQQEAHFKK